MMSSRMTEAEAEQLKHSISYAKDALDKDLLQPEAASQVRRMIVYDEERLRRFEDEQNRTITSKRLCT